MRSRDLLRNQRGMTLIEIMIVMAILGGLLAFLGTTVMTSFKKSRVQTAKLQMAELGKQLDQYNMTCNTYPTTDQGLDALLKAPGEGCSNWGPEPYVKSAAQFKDPWGTKFVYESDGGKYVLRSYGQDKKPGGASYDKDISTDEE